MPKQIRNKTAYKGVYFVELSNGEKSYFIRYKHNGKSFEERSGRSDQAWDPEKSYNLREKRITEKKNHDFVFQSKLIAAKSSRWNFSKIFARYLKLKPELKGKENDIYRFKNYIENYFGHKTPAEVINGDVEVFRENMHKRTWTKANISL